MKEIFQNSIASLQNSPTLAYLHRGKKGIEKENIRVDSFGNISQKKAPVNFGSALTHPYITKDYADAMLEIVTPPFQNWEELFLFFENIHHYIYRQLEEELLWCASVPPKIPKELTIAQFGFSNKAKMKEIYRRGLQHRYGHQMQLYSGIHLNYSFPKEVFSWAKNNLATKNKNEVYFAVIRNFFRYEWLLLYLFGASPFSIQEKGDSFATSLKRIVYVNKKEAEVSYNSFEEYQKDLLSLTQTLDPNFQIIGFKKGQEYLQLNPNILQIENELYSSIRPKPQTVSGKRPLLSLQENGVEYLEIRNLDIHPLLPMGMELEQAYFLELFLWFCLLLPSPKLTEQEKQEIQENNQVIALQGRAKNLSLKQKGKKKDLFSFAEELLGSLEQVALLLDKSKGDKKYTSSLQKQKKKLSRQTVSAKINEAVQQQKGVADFILKTSQKQQQYFLKQNFSQKWLEYFLQEKELSLEKFRELEEKQQLDFESFLWQYLHYENTT